MKRTRLRKKGVSSQAKLEQELWQECRRIVFEQYGDTCYTCGAQHLEGRNKQCGHMWPKGSLHALLKYDIRILRPQCFHCNINNGGMGAVFYKKMVADEGSAYMELLEADKAKDKQATLKSSSYYTQLLADYKTMRL